MSDYRKYLKELKSTTLFQEIEDESLIALLDAMRPEIRVWKAGQPLPPLGDGFAVSLRIDPERPIAPRRFKYAMPKPWEPGFLMGEIPALSRLRESLPPSVRKAPPHTHGYDVEFLYFPRGMLTAVYGDGVAEAQHKLLENYLGMLAQKVCDVRRELFLLRDGRDIYSEHDKTLQVFCAGVVMEQAKAVMRQWNIAHPELQAEVHVGGSADLVNRIRAGERCDLLLSADDILIDRMMPDYFKGYVIFAGNKIVLCGDGLTSDNWRDKLLDPGATFMHLDPYGDPAGYRAVMAMLLADQVEPGLSSRLMEHPGHLGMVRGFVPFGLDPDFRFAYYSQAKTKALPFTELPRVMDLSDPALADVYATASFAIDDETVIHGSPIAHALSIPVGARFPEEARQFARAFLETDFVSYGFTPLRKQVGEEIL